MKKFLIFLVLALIVGVAIAFGTSGKGDNKPQGNATSTPSVTATSTVTATTTISTIPAVTVIAKNLQIPWDIAFMPDGRMLVTERIGALSIIDKSGAKKVIYDEAGLHRGEGGLLGVVLHPGFATNHLLYLYMTAPGANGNTENRIERFRFDADALHDQTVIMKGIPGAIYHDGGRMEFGPDGYMYVTTGDATTPKIAQDLNSLGGKILRIYDDGTTPAENPYGTAVWSYGHRNPQGLAWDAAGRLWETEHGRSGVTSGLDELNLIVKGANYGWPDSEGDTVKSGTVAPVRHSGAKTTWAPASLAYLNGSLYFGGLLGQSLYEAVLDGDKIKEIKVYYNKEFGRIRTVRVGPDRMLYITTSNRDSRGSPAADDDKIIRVNPANLK